MRYQCSLFSTLYAELSRLTTVIHALIGPRQAGTTAIARQILESTPISTIYAAADSAVSLRYVLS